MDNKKCINEANQRLSDKGNYKLLQDHPKLLHSNLVKITIDRLKKQNLLSKKLADKLKSVNPIPTNFYISPKIHKESNPGRSVINN